MTGGLRAHLQSWRAAWRVSCGRLAPMCRFCDSVHARSPWGRMRRRSRGVRMQGARYCRTECLELALLEVLTRARPTPHSATIAPHRIPLGLLLLSRQQLTAPQLRTALEAQRDAANDPSQNTVPKVVQKKMKIGGWLQELGFVTEQQVTAALARQWSCPILRTGPAAMSMTASRLSPIFPGIPVPLLESFQMMPVELVEATGTLLIAFSEGIDYTILYAIEQMLGYRTEACLVSPSILQKGLQALARRRGTTDVVFERMEDAGECAHIIGNYSAKVKATDVRLARCGDHLWIRLERQQQAAINLVLHTGSQFAALSPQHL
jgi:Type II secretion system (T2SS), protein E, N-terminal domain